MPRWMTLRLQPAAQRLLRLVTRVDCSQAKWLRGRLQLAQLASRVQGQRLASWLPLGWLAYWLRLRLWQRRLRRQTVQGPNVCVSLAFH